jgi:hypothetical protein
MILAARREGRCGLKPTPVCFRAADRASRTIHFTHAGGSGRGAWRAGFIAPKHVPDFEDEEGWRALERVKAGSWSSRRAIRRLDPPPHA